MQLHEPQTVSMAEKNCFSHYVCHCGAVVKELFARADKPDSTPCDAVFCLLVVLFCFVLYIVLIINIITLKSPVGLPPKNN